MASAEFEPENSHWVIPEYLSELMSIEEILLKWQNRGLFRKLAMPTYIKWYLVSATEK
jgi:hypothetical protein